MKKLLIIEISYKASIELLYNIDLICCFFNIRIPIKYRNSMINKRVEYLLSRLICFLLLKKLGAEGDCIVRNNTTGIPVWPKHFKGSISHTNNKILVSLSKDSSITSMGVDIEKIKHMDSLSIYFICSKKEISKINMLNTTVYLILIFSIKESAFKCFYPILNIKSLKEIEIFKMDFKNMFSIVKCKNKYLQVNFFISLYHVKSWCYI